MSQALVVSHLRRKVASSIYAFTQSLGYATGSKIKEIANVPEWEAFVSGSKSSGRPFIVEFTAAWCPPCKMIAPVLEELAAKHTDVDFVKVDIDNQDVTPVVVENNVSAVPTFVSMRGEKKLTTFSGADKGQLLRMVQEVSEL